ncbi:MAG TPA: hypothetical protein V6D17_18110 [Candidatus Obscuribacterales bacterium]
MEKIVVESQEVISDAFARSLAAKRSWFNSRFAEVRHMKPALDAEDFAAHLKSTVSPIVEAAARANPSSVDSVVENLYEVSLQLVASNLAGPRSRCKAIVDGWTKLFPHAAQILASSPGRFVSSITNALYNLSICDARVSEWIDIMVDVAALTDDLDVFLDAGKLACWRSGMAQYRSGALETLTNLPSEIALTALRIESSGTKLSASDLRDRLLSDPWLHPIDAEATGMAEDLELVAVLGNFRGFGGLFQYPPRVKYVNDQFVVSSGQDSWLMNADIFGANFHRIELEEGGSSKHHDSECHFLLDGDGTVSHATRPIKKRFPEIANPTSHAGSDKTLAVTVELSHHIYVFALANRSRIVRSNYGSSSKIG